MLEYTEWTQGIPRGAEAAAKVSLDCAGCAWPSGMELVRHRFRLFLIDAVDTLAVDEASLDDPFIDIGCMVPARQWAL